MGSLVYQTARLIFGVLNPAYRSFKAVKTRNVKEYVFWMTYWIVLAVVTVVEEFADVLLGIWFPFYYEIKTVFLLWLISPITRGSVILYRQLIHPILMNKEEEIDEIVQLWKEQSYHLGIKYTKVAAEKITQTVLKTAISGGNGLMKSLHHSYSLNDLSQNSLTDEHEHSPVAVKRTMSVNRRERAHQSPSSRSEVVKRRNISSSRTSLKSSDSTTTKTRPMSSSKIGENSNSSGTSKTCSLYGTLPRNTKRKPIEQSYSQTQKDRDRKRGSRQSLMFF